MSILFSQFCEQNNQIVPQEAVFTEVLASIALVPKMLYFYGKLPENGVKEGAGARKRARGERPPVLAVVGTRRPTSYGEHVAYELAFAAAKAGAVVVSGLAYGIDSIAHRAALDAGGVTVAVLGTAIDDIYPKAHIALAEEIIEKGGAIISEVAPGVRYGSKNEARACFLKRNRLISGLADVVVIPEAAERSGSLNTAAHAVEQGKEVFAVPGDITRPMSVGCNRLLQSAAAGVYTGVEDVLSVLFPGRAREARPQADLTGDTDTETAILGALATGIAEGGEIIEDLNLTVTEFNQNMTMLEIKGRVVPLGMNRWALKL